MVRVTPADATESAVQKIARRAEGERISTQHLFDLIMAVDEDANARHREEVRMAKQVAQAHDARLKNLEGWRSDWEANCASRLQASLNGLRIELEAGHLALHEQHMNECHVPRRAGDPPAVDWSDRRGSGAPADDDEARKIWVLWGIGQRLVLILTALVTSGLTILLSYIIFGKP